MRLVDISSFFSDACGGIKTYYRSKARFLPPLGFDCHFVVPGRADSEEAFEGAVMHRVAGPALPGNAHYRLFGEQEAVVRLLARLRPDVVELGSHYVLPGWVARVVAERGGRLPVVGFFHSDVPRTLVAPAVARLPGPLRRAALAASWRFFARRHEAYQATLVASRRLGRTLEERGIPRVRWVGLGVDVDVFRPAPRALGGPPVVAYAGRLSSDKSFALLLAAWPSIRAATGAVLRVVGDGPQRAALLRAAAADASVEYGGCLQRPAEVAAFLAAADLAVTPGARETFSLATAEALACGTPVLARSALVRAAVSTLALPPEARMAMGARGRAHVAGRLSWPAVTSRLADAYRAVV